MKRFAIFVLLLAGCGGESKRELGVQSTAVECAPPYSFPGECLDLCFPYDGRCSANGYCSCPRVGCDPCGADCPTGLACAVEDGEFGCFAPEDIAPAACVP